MRLIFVFFLFLSVIFANAQNSYLYTEGEKILIKDWESFGYYKGNIEYARYNGENKSSWYKHVSVEKIDSITVEGKVTYRPLKLNGLKKVFLYKTLISSPDKKVLVAFFRYDNYMKTFYYIVDNNLTLLEKGSPSGSEDRAIFFRSLEKHFPACESVLESIKHYESLSLDYYKLEYIPGPWGFPYQKKVFNCN